MMDIRTSVFIEKHEKKTIINLFGFFNKKILNLNFKTFVKICMHIPTTYA